MTVPVLSNRHVLLRRGWYVASEVELAFMGLSGRAHDLLIILKHLQGDNPDAFPKRERLAGILGVSVRTVQNALNELRRKGAITSRRTSRHSRHAASYGRLTVAELQTLMGAEMHLPHELLETRDVQDSGTSEVQGSCTPIEEEPLTKNHLTTTSLREVGGAAAPHEATPQEDEMGFQGMRPHGVIVDELDPATAFGLHSPQDAPEGLPDSPEGLFPAQEVAPARTGRHRAVRSQAQRDTPMALAVELDRQLRNADWDAGPAPVNRAGLARNLSAWKRDGVTADQIRSMIERYVTDPAMRRAGVAPWIDFVGKRHKLLAVLGRAAEARAVEDHRDADAAYWLGSAA